MTSVTYDVGHESTVLTLARGDSLAASGDENGLVALWDAQGQRADKIRVGQSGVNALCFSEQLLYASSGPQIHCYDTRSLSTAVDTYDVNTEDVNELHLKQKYLVACDDSGQIKLINLSDKRVRTLKKHENICSTMDFRPNFNSELLSGGLDYKMIRWDVFKGKAMKLYDMKQFEDNDDRTEFLVSPPMVHCLRCSVGGATALALENGTVQIFDSSQKPLVNKGRFLGHNKGVSQVHFLANDCVVSGGNDGYLFIHRFEMTNQIRWTAESTRIEHGSAVNWLMSWEKLTNSILVADQTNLISVRHFES